MTLNLRIALLCAICIFVSGLLGSFKSHQIYGDRTVQHEVDRSLEVSAWVGQSLEQKLLQMESAVSYLDQSTIETLKRLGARYFAYAYMKNDDWSLKWKVLGSLDKAGILAEVNELPFAELGTDVRHWAKNSAGQSIFISPVALADSHQLKSGFLVFGLSDDFFGFLQDQTSPLVLLDAGGEKVSGALSESLANLDILGDDEQKPSLVVEQDDQSLVVTRLFSPKTQLWLVREHSVAVRPFLASSFFIYFLLAGALSVLVLFFALGPIRRRSLFSLSLIRPRLKKQILPEEEVSADVLDPSDEIQVIHDFGDFLDEVLSEDLERMTKVGVKIKTQVEEGASVTCSPQHVSDFIKRLIGNSVLALETETEKEIQIQLVEQADTFQLIYVDTRTSHFPSGTDLSLLAQTDGSMEGIDGIIAYASWLFGDALTVAKQGFCLSVDLAKPVDNTVPATPEVLPLVDELKRIEIDDSETDPAMMAQFSDLEPIDISSATRDEDEEPSVSFDDVIEQFKMKEFSFKEEQTISAIESPDEDVAEPESDGGVSVDDRGLFEINSGQFKIKIRSPKKKDSDVNR